MALLSSGMVSCTFAQYPDLTCASIGANQRWNVASLGAIAFDEPIQMFKLRARIIIDGRRRRRNSWVNSHWHKYTGMPVGFCGHDADAQHCRKQNFS